MLREDCKVGQQVYFGRPNGEQTLGRVVKMNPAKAKVETLEQRGDGRGSTPGAVWHVPYSLMRPAGDASPETPTLPAPRPPLGYNPFAGEDNLILEAIVCCHCGLSPENLACDGEASMGHIQRRGAELRRKLKHLQLALGRDVSECEAYEWDTLRRQWLKQREEKAS